MIRSLSFTLAASAAALCVSLTACKKNEPGTGGGGGDPSKPIIAGKYTILETITDQANQTNAKRNAENALQKYADLTAFVGLWSYNAPQCIEALKSTGKLGKVKVFAFDEDPVTLQAIDEGNCEGTIVQQPYQFGYLSMKYLKDVSDGKSVEIPDSKEIPVPVKVVTKETVKEFQENLAALKASAAAAASNSAEGAPKFAFVINNSSDFWSYALAGLKKAEADLGIIAEFQSPAEATATGQNRLLENIIQKGGYKGIAISPIDPENQTAALNAAAEKLPLICHDSDAPASKRRFYIGTNNTDAGREMGKLIKKILPDGGKLIITVGKLDALNAKQRREGLIEELGK